MKTTRMLGLLAASALLVLQSCKKNETNLIKQAALTGSPKKGVHWNPGDVIINGKYKFSQYQNPSKAVCVVGPSTSDGALIHHWDYVNQGTDLQWNIVNRVTVSGTIYYSLQNVYSGKALEVPTGAVAGTQLQQRTYAGNDRQLWSIKHVIYTVYLIVNKSTGMALTLDQTNPGANGAKITQTPQTWPGVASQHFLFTNLDEFFLNPLKISGPDPYVTYRNGFYYFMTTTGYNITIYKTAKMSELRYANPVVIWTPPPGTDHSADIWAPELWYLDGKWYLYFTASNGTHAGLRTFVLESSSQDPTNTGAWSFKGKVATSDDQLAIDGTIFQSNADRYYIWAGDNMIHIAQMSNPWTLIGARSTILTANLSWEGGVIEGPEILKSGTKTFIIYSANGCWTDNYQLGQATLIYPNALLAGAWQKKSTAVLTGNPYTSVWGPGHNGFFTSGGENWIVYHANPVSGLPNPCGSERSPRMEKFTFNASDEPYFTPPEGLNTALRQPAGE